MESSSESNLFIYEAYMIIYKITNKLNGKIYIGKTGQSLERRWCKHLNEAKHHDKRHLYRAINKYGKNEFSIEVIECCKLEVVSEREKFWIKHYNSNDQTIGYNLTEGGENGLRSEEYKARISQTLKTYFRVNGPPPNPTKGKFGKQHHFYGKHHTHKTKRKLSVARNGKKYEDVMDIDVATELRQMHRDKWMGNNNPSFKDVDMSQLVQWVKQYPLITVEDICAKYNLSRPTVVSKFKQYTGLTFEKYKKEVLGFNAGVYKRLKNLGVDKSVWSCYSSAQQYDLSCHYERSDNTENLGNQKT